MRTPSRLRPKSFFRHSPLVAALACALGSPVALGATVQVTNNLDDALSTPAGSLRAAIEFLNVPANCSGTGDLITFTGPFVVQIAAPLPDITCPYVTITANAGPGGNPIEPAAGFLAPNFAFCFAFNSPLATPLSVQGLEMRNFAAGSPVCGLLNLTSVNSHNNQYGAYAYDGSTITTSDFSFNTYGLQFDGGGTLTGSQVSSNTWGVFAGSNSTITNNVIHDNLYLGLRVDNGSVIRDNQIYRSYNGIDMGTLRSGGVTITGNTVYENAYQGIYASGPATVVGGAAPADRNFVYANGTGIYVSYGGTVEGNYVGTADGNTAAPNTEGIIVLSSATIKNNVISGNIADGIQVSDLLGTTIQGNLIGTNAAGDAPLGNGDYGIYFNFSYGGSQITGNTIAANGGAGISINSASGITNISSNMIGVRSDGMAGMGNSIGINADCSSGIYVSSNNIISGNTFEGIYFSGVSNSRIWINKIGVASDAMTAIPNDSGVFLDASFCVGGPTGSTGIDIHGNVIAKNVHDGIAVNSSFDPLHEDSGNPFSENSAYGNGRKNISLDVYGGPLPNDDMDGDTGPNNRQNYPVITSIGQGAGQTIVTYSLNSTPGGNFNIEFFANATGGAPAAEQFLGGTSPSTTDLSGNTAGTMTFSGLHDFISATATNTLTLDTSEISAIFSLIPVPAVNVSPPVINFGSIPVGSSSGTQSVTLTSTGNVPYRINQLSASPSCYGGPICSGGDSGDFMCSTGTCATFTDFASGTSCNLTGTFAPNSTGAKSTTFYVCDNASGSPRAITFSGTGIVPPPITMSPSSFNFGSLVVGQSGAPQDFTIANPGSASLPIGPVTTSGNFSVVFTNCESAIPPRSSCVARVAFTPTLAGSLSGLVSVAAASGPAASLVSASLSGIGTNAAVLVLPSAIDLGSFTVGSTTPLHTSVDLRNSGSAALTLGAITVTGPFTLVNPCPINLLPGASCSLILGFSATTSGEFNGTLTVLSNASGGSRVIPVAARAQLVAAPVIKVTPTFIGFGDRLAGTPSASQRVTVTNEGGVDAVLGPITADIDFLVVGTTCGLTLAQASTCFADVALRPMGFGPRVGVLRVTSNAAGSPHEVNLLGTGCRPFSITGNRLGTRSNCVP